MKLATEAPQAHPRLQASDTSPFTGSHVHFCAATHWSKGLLMTIAPEFPKETKEVISCTFGTFQNLSFASITENISSMFENVHLLNPSPR